MHVLRQLVITDMSFSNILPCYCKSCCSKDQVLLGKSWIYKNWPNMFSTLKGKVYIICLVLVSRRYRYSLLFYLPLFVLIMDYAPKPRGFYKISQVFSTIYI